MELHIWRSRHCDRWLRHLPGPVAQHGLDSVGHTRMGTVTTPAASMQGHFLLVVVRRSRRTPWYCCALMVVLGPAGLDYAHGMSLLSVRLHPNMHNCPFFCAACSWIHSHVTACDHLHVPPQPQTSFIYTTLINYLSFCWLHNSITTANNTVLDNNSVSDKPTERIWNKDCVLTTSIPWNLNGGRKEKHSNLSQENKSLAWNLTDDVANLQYSANHSCKLMNIML
jgi:hypothetical protein